MPSPLHVIGVGSALVDTLVAVEDAFMRDISGERGGMEMVDDAGIANNACAVQIFEVAFSRRICCSRVCNARR